MQYTNVRERFMLYDTVGMWTPPAGSGIVNPPGWFLNYAGLGAQNQINFFNQRSRANGLMWSNQDKRDSMSFGFRLHSIGVKFWAQPITGFETWTTVAGDLYLDDYASHVFVNDVPRHCGVTFQVQQDDRLKTHAFFCPPGYGVSGGGYARGEITSGSFQTGLTNGNVYDHHLAVHSQGIPHLENRYPFPKPIEIPRDASISVRLEFNEYARALLAVLPWLDHGWGEVDPAADDIEEINPFAGIQVSLLGERLVQQRGALHR